MYVSPRGCQVDGRGESSHMSKFTGWKRTASSIGMLAVGAALGVVVATRAPSSAQVASCPTGDCIAESITTQAQCQELTSGPEGSGPGWDRGLNTNVDQRITGGDVVAYQIEWSSGWSGWYVTGVNDIDHKYNTGTRDMRRVWSYFADHNHRFILCR